MVYYYCLLSFLMVYQHLSSDETGELECLTIRRKGKDTTGHGLVLKWRQVVVFKLFKYYYCHLTCLVAIKTLLWKLHRKLLHYLPKITLHLFKSSQPAITSNIQLIFSNFFFFYVQVKSLWCLCTSFYKEIKFCLTSLGYLTFL